LRDEPRNATIVARSKCVFYTLGKADFKHVLSRSRSFVEELRNVLASRT
jgi:CRP-like cAMP-binding protein